MVRWTNETDVVRRDRFASDTPMEASFDLVSILFVESDHVATEHAYGWPDESLHVLGLLRRDDDSAVLAFDTCRDAVRSGLCDAWDR